MQIENNYKTASDQQAHLSSISPDFPKVHMHSLLCLWAIDSGVLDIQSIQLFIQNSNCSPSAAWYAVFGYALLESSFSNSVDYVSIANPEQVKLLVNKKILPASILNSQINPIIFTAPNSDFTNLGDFSAFDQP